MSSPSSSISLPKTPQAIEAAFGRDGGARAEPFARVKASTALQVKLRAPRQVPLPEPGAHHRGALETGPVTAEPASPPSKPPSTRPTSANTLTGSMPRWRWWVSTSSPRSNGRQAQMNRRGDGAAKLERRAEGRRAGRLCAGRRARGGDLRRRAKLEPGMAFEGPGHRRGSGDHRGGPSRQPRRGRRLRQYRIHIRN